MRELILAVLLACAGGLVVRGAFVAHETAGWVVAGVMLAVWSVVALHEGPAKGPEGDS